jgi:Sec-independent protein translocase protein TatA
VLVEEASRAGEAVKAMEEAMGEMKRELSDATHVMKEVLDTVKEGENAALALSQSMLSLSERVKEGMLAAECSALDANQAAAAALRALNEQVLPQARDRSTHPFF